MKFPALVLVFGLIASPLAQAQTCEPLKAGEARVVLERRIPGLPATYVLEREEDRVLAEDYSYPGAGARAGERVPSYAVTVDLTFVNPQGAPSEFRAEMEARAQGCFDASAQQMRGPRGEYLRLFLKKNRAGSQSPNPRRVVVHKEKMQANISNWPRNVSCSVLIHEVLHVVGLADEYADPYAGCRKLGPKDSLMRSSGMKLEGKPSILMPAHFYFVAEPGCPRRSALYATCASEAMLSSNSCRTDLPAACDSTDWPRAFE